MIKSNLQLSLLFNEAKILNYLREGEYIEMACSQSGNALLAWPQIRKAAEEIAVIRGLNVAYVMVNRLLKGQVTPQHRDWLKGTPLQPQTPTIERWHLPLVTNDKCFFLQEGKEPLFMELGHWHGPVEYWKLHSVSNGGDNDRYHLIVDLDCPTPLGTYD